MLDNIYIGEPNDVIVESLKNDASGEYVNDATITGQVRTSGDSPTAGTRIGSVFNVTYIAASNGNYRGTFPSTDAASLAENTTYWVWVTAASVTLRRLACKAIYREKT